jgi:hypothetical protein
VLSRFWYLWRKRNEALWLLYIIVSVIGDSHVAPKLKYGLTTIRAAIHGSIAMNHFW